MEVGIAQVQRLAPRQRRERVRKLLGAGHPRALEEHRDHPDVALQGCSDFMADEVTGVLQPPPPLGIGDREPVPADERDQDVARAYRALDGLHEVEAGLDAVDIHEDVVAAVMVAQAVMQATGRRTALLAPVADEDACHLPASPGVPPWCASDAVVITTVSSDALSSCGVQPTH